MMILLFFRVLLMWVVWTLFFDKTYELRISWEKVIAFIFFGFLEIWICFGSLANYYIHYHLELIILLIFGWPVIGVFLGIVYRLVRGWKIIPKLR